METAIERTKCDACGRSYTTGFEYLHRNGVCARPLSCGCGRGCGCVCVNHQDAPNGRPARRCLPHAAGSATGAVYGVLKAMRLYVGDNGRTFCGTLRCAGTSAYITGVDRSGQRVLELTTSDATRIGARCETCGGGVLR